MSRFVSAGSQQEPSDADEAWLKAQQHIDEASQRSKQEGSGQQEGGKTLYEVLQANKAAKQEAFEESIRLKNQFRALDEDEIDFLDSVLESTRAKDAAIQKETTEQLDSFRKQQEDAEKAVLAERNDGEAVEQDSSETWQVSSRKRRKGRENSKASKVAKLRKLSSSDAADPRRDESSPFSLKSPTTASNPVKKQGSNPKIASVSIKENKDALSPERSSNRADETAESKTSKGPTTVGLGLVSYSSDEGSED